MNEALDARGNSKFLDNLAVEVTYLARLPPLQVALLAHETNEYEISRVAAKALIDHENNEEAAWTWLQEKYNP